MQTSFNMLFWKSISLLTPFSFCLCGWFPLGRSWKNQRMPQKNLKPAETQKSTKQTRESQTQETQVASCPELPPQEEAASSGCQKKQCEDKTVRQMVMGVGGASYYSPLSNDAAPTLGAWGPSVRTWQAPVLRKATELPIT